MQEGRIYQYKRSMMQCKSLDMWGKTLPWAHKRQRRRHRRVTGIVHGRGGREEKLRVFLSYRVASDANLVERLYGKLRADGVEVWWDKKCLQTGQPWEQGFADGLCTCNVFVPVLSKAALAPFENLSVGNSCNNVLLEYRMALELRQRGDTRAIVPILVGEIKCDDDLGEKYCNFFDGGIPTCSDIAVKAVQAKLIEHLHRLGKGPTRLPNTSLTVKGTLSQITRSQVVKIFGIPADTMDQVIFHITQLQLPVSFSREMHSGSEIQTIAMQTPADISIVTPEMEYAEEEGGVWGQGGGEC